MYNDGTSALSGTSGDRDSDDGRPLSLANSRRPSISAPISRKSSTSRVHSPPLASPSSHHHLLEDGSTSTPKRLSEGNKKKYFWQKKFSKIFIFTDNDASSKRPESVASSVDCKDSDLDNKNRDSVEIKREGSMQLDSTLR